MADLTVNDGLTAEIGREALYDALTGAEAFYAKLAEEDEATFERKREAKLQEFRDQMTARMAQWEKQRNEHVEKLLKGYDKVLVSSKGMLWWRKDTYRKPTHDEVATFRAAAEDSYARIYHRPDSTREYDYYERMDQIRGWERRNFTSRYHTKKNRCKELLASIDRDDITNIRLAEADLRLINEARSE